jgi:hypothetical protein
MAIEEEEDNERYSIFSSTYRLNISNNQKEEGRQNIISQEDLNNGIDHIT